MPIEIEDNPLDGRSYLVPSVGDLAELPAEVRALVSDFDRSILEYPNSHADELASRGAEGSLQRYLEALADGYFHRLAIHTSPFGGGLHEILFEYFVGEEGLHGIQFRDGSDVEPDCPAPLRPVAAFLGKIDPTVWGYAGGQLRVVGADRFTSMGWLEEAKGINADECRQVYTDLCGNVIGCDARGDAIFCDHGALTRLGPFAPFLDLYFDRLIAGQSVVEAAEMVAAYREVVPQDQTGGQR